MKIREKIKGSLLNLRKSVERFPITILVSVILTIVLIYLVENNSTLTIESRERLGRIAMVVGMGIPLSLVIGLFNERFEKSPILKWGIYGLGGIVLFLYYTFLLQDFRMVEITRYIATMIFLVIVVFYILKIKHDVNYEVFVIKIFSGIFLTILYCGVLFGGLAAIYATIEGLFDVNIKDELYLYTFFIVVFIFGLSMLLSKIPEKDEDFLDYNYARSLKVLLAYIVIPLISIYTLILYAYFVKILVEWEWPRGLVSHLVIWYSAISVGVIFLITPVIEENKVAKLFRTIFPIANLPILLMMYISIFQRINQYGFTENRYYIVIFGLWITGMMLYFIIKRPLKNIFIPISLSIIVFLSVYGPVSSYSISKWSQNTRFNNILESNNMIQNGNIVPNPQLEIEAQRQLNSIVKYFISSHDVDDLKALPDEFEIGKMEDTFGFKYEPYYPGIDGDQYFGYYLDIYDKPINIDGYDYYVQMSSWRENETLVDTLSMSYNRGNKTLSISENSLELISVDIGEMALEVHTKKEFDFEGKNIVSLSDMTFDAENQNIKVRLIFTNINGRFVKATERIEVKNAEFILLIGR